MGEAPVSLGNMDDLPCGESETRLLPQTFLPDPKYTVAQYLTLQDARVLDFIRFQCGESSSQGEWRKPFEDINDPEWDIKSMN